MTNTGTGFASVTAWPVSDGPAAAGTWLYLYQCVESGGVNSGLFDINGDGLPDRVMSMYNTEGAVTNFRVQFNTGTNFTPIKLFGPYHSQNWNTDASSYVWTGIETPYVHMVDLNGDGLPDRVMLPMNPSSPVNPVANTARTNFVVEFDDGYSFEAVNTSTNIGGAADVWPGVNPQIGGNADYAEIQNLPYVGLYDLNGDGLPDRVMLNDTNFGTPSKSWLVYLNNGHGFDANPIVVTNIECQGQYSDSGATWWGMQTSFYNSTLVTLADINGDGLLDRVMAVYNNGVSPNGYSNYFLVQLNNGPFPDLLTNVNNGIGGAIAVTYRSSTAYPNYRDPANTNSGSLLPFPKQTVVTVTESDGINPARPTSYGYAGGFYDGGRREFHGFAMVTVTNPPEPIAASFNRRTVYYFHQGGGQSRANLGEYLDPGNFAKDGMAYRVETYGNDNNLYKVVINQVNQAGLGNGRYFPFVQATFECDSGNGTTNRVTATQFVYDISTGNLTNKIVYGEVNSFNPTNVGSFSFTDNAADTKYYNTHFTTIGTYIVDHPDKVTLTDGNNNIVQETDYTYNPGSGTIATKLTRISAGYYATNSYGNYNNYGLVGLTTDPVGVQTTITYDPTYNTYPATTIVGGSFTTTTTYDARSGLLAVSTDLTGVTVSNSFDAFCRPVESDKIPVGGGASIWMKKYSYPATLKPIVSGLATNYTDVINNDGVSGVEGRTYIDGLGRPIQTRTQGENGNYRMIAIAYDERGNAFLTTWPVFTTSISFSKPASGLTASWIGYDAAGRVATNRAVNVTFDANGAFSSKTDLTGDGTSSPLAAKTWSYANGSDPWWIVCTDEDGKIRRYGLDAFGRTNQIQEVDGANIYITMLKYDLANNLTNIVNANTQSIYYAYNDAGGLVAMADPHLGQWTYVRDYAGRLRVQTDGRGDVVSNSYVNASSQQDPLGRLQVQTVFSLNYSNHVLIPAYTNVYVYDNSDDGNFTMFPGLLYKVTDGEGWEKTGYDSRTRVIKTARRLNINNQTYTNTFTFDDGDNVTSVAYPNSGPIITNLYFTGRSLKQVSRGTYKYYAVNAADIDEFSHVTSFRYDSGLTTTRAYYSTSKRLQSITCGTVFSRTFTYTTNEDIASLSGTGISGTVNATYDNLHRIKTYTGPSSSYGYDSVGNMTTNIESGSAVAYSYANPRKQAVRTAFGYTNLYDLCGNMIVRHGGLTNSQAMVYDAENRLKIFSQAGKIVVEYGYAADGARLWKRVNQSVTNVQVWIGNIYEEKGGKILFHVFAGGQQVCTFETNSPLMGGGDSSKVGYYYHEDNLNSSCVLSSSGGIVQETNVYYPFGRIQTTASQPGTFQVSRQFTGQIKDDETGLYYYNARYYDPELGRFIQADTVIPDLSNPQSYNRYSYCVNNPLRYTDPTGHGFWSNFNPSLLWDPEVGQGIGYWLVRDPSSSAPDRNSYIAQRGMGTLTDENGNKVSGGEAVAKVGKAVLKGPLEAAMWLAGPGEEKMALNAGKILKEGWFAKVGKEAIQLGENQAVSGIVKEGKVIGIGDPWLGHAELAKKLGIQLKNGELPKGMEGFLAQKTGGKVSVIGAGINDPSGEIMAISEAAKKTAGKFFK